jgi:hypothetical protein
MLCFYLLFIYFYFSKRRPRFEPQSTVHTEWQLPLSDVHPIMMKKSALAGESGRCTPTPFQPITITYKVAVYCTLLLRTPRLSTLLSELRCTLMSHPLHPIELLLHTNELRCTLKTFTSVITSFCFKIRSVLFKFSFLISNQLQTIRSKLN